MTTGDWERAHVEIIRASVDAGYGHGWHLIVDGEYAQTFGTKRAAEAAAARILKERGEG